MASSFINDFFSPALVRRFFPRHKIRKASQKQRLHLRNIYIVPTLAGLGLLAVAVVTLVSAINFQNSLVYAVSFWLAALLIVNILHTFRNLSGLQIELLGAEPCFAGQNSLVSFRLSTARSKQSIYLGWKGIDMVRFGLDGVTSSEIEVSYPAPQRGYLRPPRVDILTRYPTGLSLAWAYAHLDIRAIVYPEPIELPEVSQHAGEGEEADDGVGVAGGVQDFSGLRAYQPGDSLRRIHWPNYARSGKLYSKVFVDYQSHDHWLEWDSLISASVEQRLSHLCARVLELDAKQQSFGLRMPGKVIQPNHGEAHRLACLTALALFPSQP